MQPKLLTKETEKLLPPLYSQENNDDPVVVAKWFSPYSNWRWYAYEGERQDDGDWLFFGWVRGAEDEFGYWSLSELENATAMGGKLPLVERDMYWTPTPLSKIKSGETV